MKITDNLKHKALFAIPEPSYGTELATYEAALELTEPEKINVGGGMC
ncbi:hypothetical protein LGZ99_20275 [Photorhabdus temperata]|uniref:Uncharacterized protein n=2 Tax=Photorhabdus temperata TaxID=574560 RepID=A0A081RQU7_PHOTE|nr:hypothetical protein [Photorhabdus temperata]ERT12732.1 hypothetical protein O185_12750 [Photorhabdus temperata J3]KER01050.1 hypothetical protein MEG1DRAFT_04321 [Photorhabdus temperata subsp. temperata Meg1]MCT8349466.1 hypothetical protein [Photorhabdus temperata]